MKNCKVKKIVEAPKIFCKKMFWTVFIGYIFFTFLFSLATTFSLIMQISEIKPEYYGWSFNILTKDYGYWFISIAIFIALVLSNPQIWSLIRINATCSITFQKSSIKEFTLKYKDYFSVKQWGLFITIMELTCTIGFQVLLEILNIVAFVGFKNIASHKWIYGVTIPPVVLSILQTIIFGAYVSVYSNATYPKIKSNC